MRLFGSRRARRADVDKAQDGADAAQAGRPQRGRALAEVGELMRRNRERRDPELERRLVHVRHEAFEELDRSSPGAGPEVSTEEASLEEAVVEQGVPVISPRRVTAAGVRAAILSHGCVHVPGLLSASRAEELATGIDLAFTGHDAGGDDPSPRTVDGWYEPFKLPGWRPGVGRQWNRDSGAIWAADSPRLMYELSNIFEELGLRELITGYLGERPVLSVNKSVLRRVSPRAGGADWHQDGAFMGADIRSLNVWLTLSSCGQEAPGMDLVPRRLDGIVETGSEGANFDWSVAPAVVERVAGEAGVARPVFGPGDALLFDHLFLHRTASHPGMTRDRYAIETWFFASSAYPPEHVPLVL